MNRLAGKAGQAMITLSRSRKAIHSADGYDEKIAIALRDVDPSGEREPVDMRSNDPQLDCNIWNTGHVSAWTEYVPFLY